MRPLILLTRPEAQGKHFARELEKRGYATLLSPLLTIAPLTPHFDAADIRGVLLTSRHALSAVETQTSLHALPCFAVGAATAAAAKNAGFSCITHAPTARALAALIPPEASPLLYARGRHIAFGFGPALAPRGVILHEIIAYEARAVTHFSAAARTAIAEERIAAIPFFSARTAHIFSTLIVQENLAPHVRHVHAIAISAAAAESIAHLPWRRVTIAEAPDAAHLATAIDKQLSEG